MRRKSDMWQDYGNGSFLPGEGEQAAHAATADLQARLASAEEQIKAQFTAMAAYAQIAQEAVESAREEARADLGRERALLVSLVERVRNERLAGEQAAAGAGSAERLDVLESKFDHLTEQLAEILVQQQAISQSIEKLSNRRRPVLAS